MLGKFLIHILRASYAYPPVQLEFLFIIVPFLTSFLLWTRSATDELQNTSGGCPSEILPSSANNGTQSLMDSAGDNDAKNQLHFHASEMSENQRKADENDENMERALQHKAQLIGQYEAEEKAQREWEEKYRENNSYAQVYL